VSRDPPLDRARRIRLLVLDVDGVLTDGRLYFGANGEELKAFDVRDGAGLVAIQRAGVSVAIVSGRSSPAVERRAAELGIRLVRQGATDKAHELETLATRLGAARDEIACVCDDTPDLGVMRRCALAIAVADAHGEVIEAADWVTTRKGGRGAVREVCDLLLRARQAPASV
jgi:3-deoxy-D-manno-octulosonate 8-phosphate phosphatase (KDO 8-P phosphatase)